MTPGFDLTRLTAGGTVVEHVVGTIETDGPWLIVRDAQGLALLLPAHAVVVVTLCEDEARCGAGG